MNDVGARATCTNRGCGMGVGGMRAGEGDKKLSDEAQNKYKIQSCSNTNSVTAESLSGVR